MKTTIFKSSFTLLLSLISTLTFAQQSDLQMQLIQAISEKKADVGIAVIIDGKDTITVNNTTHFPLMSVFKFHQALGVADYLGKKKMPLSTKLPIKKEDLKPNTYSPLRDKYPEGGIDMSVAELLKYTLQQSDNNACDILFHLQGGPRELNKYIQSLGIHSPGIRDCNIVANENDMHEDLNLCYANWSTPLAAAELVETFFRKELFADKAYKDFIYRTMTECETGKDRLVAPLLYKKGVVTGHKTGTGDRNAKGQQIAVNDIGFVLLPDGRSYSIAVFVKDSDETPQANSRIIAEISHLVYEYVTNQ